MSLEQDGRLFLDALEKETIPYMVVGAVAQANYATPRMTSDLDIQVQLDRPPGPGATTYLGAIIEERTHDPVFDQDVIILHLPTRPTPIELFVISHWYTKQALTRRIEAASDVFGRSIPIPRAEDQLLLKACIRRSPTRRSQKRAQDGVDMEDLVRANYESLDREYLKTTAERLDLWPDIEKILRGAAAAQESTQG